MREIEIYDIKLLDLELFLFVTKYGSFTKAGEKMHMAQSWVSKRIHLLETELGLPLFIRNKRSLTLTPAGNILAERLAHITDDIRDALQEAHNAQKGTSGYLRIGFLEWGTNAFIKKLDHFMENNPQVSIDLLFQQFQELRTSMETDKLDIIFTMAYESSHLSQKEYHIIPIQRVPLMAYVSRKNPLSMKEMITIEDLRPESMLMLDQKSAPSYHEYINQLFRMHNVRPLISQYAHNGREHIGNIMLNKGILIASQFFLVNEFSEQIAAVAIKDCETDITAIWKKKNSNSLIPYFLRELTGLELPTLDSVVF